MTWHTYSCASLKSWPDSTFWEFSLCMEQVRNVKNEDEYDVSLFCMGNDCKLLYKHTFVIINAIQTASKSIQASWELGCVWGNITEVNRSRDELWRELLPGNRTGLLLLFYSCSGQWPWVPVHQLESSVALLDHHCYRLYQYPIRLCFPMEITYLMHKKRECSS